MKKIIALSLVAIFASAVMAFAGEGFMCCVDPMDTGCILCLDPIDPPPPPDKK